MMLNYLHGTPVASGVIKANPEDFVVVEDLGYGADGEGEHLLVRIRKVGPIPALWLRHWRSISVFISAT